MSATHQGLLIPADTPVHRLAPQCKVAATALFVFAVACTPTGAYSPYLWYLLLLTVVALVMLKTGATRVDAQRKLREAKGNVRKAIEG